MVSDACFSSTVNPCCYFPCQNQGVCVRFGLEHYECDCTRTGYSGPNCTVREPRFQPPSSPGPHSPLDPPPGPHFWPLSVAMVHL